MIILDENVLHAGSESMTCGYAPIHSPRYFSYVHHKNEKVNKDYTYNKFDMCPDNCLFCSNNGILEIASHLENSIFILNSGGLSLATKNHCTDWIAGDLKVLGWVVVRNGVPVSDQFEMKLSHEFQTILCTNRMLKFSTKSTWKTILSNNETIDKTIPATFRSYLFKDGTTSSKNSSINWGQRKMIPVT